MTEDRISKQPEKSATAGRQKKKRRWDQPAEGLLAAGVNPALLPISTALLTNQVLVNSPSILHNTTAVVQKLNQPKIQDELIAREIIINDAEPTIRYKLTKRQTQEEIQNSTGAIVITRGKYRLPNGLPDTEKPLYLHISASAHLKDTAERIKAVDHAAFMVEEILRQGQVQQSASKHLAPAITDEQETQPLSICLFLGFETDPLLNIVARIRGPNDQYINHIMNETGATVVLRGRGSGNVEDSNTGAAHQSLHLYLSSTNRQSFEAAKMLAENLLDTIRTECCASRITSSKIYSACPPPPQLLAGVQSSGVQGSTFNIGNRPSGIPQPVVHCSYPSLPGGTCYSGYGDIYPQATPLQQVALALRKPPSTAISVPSVSTMSTVPKSNPNLSAEAKVLPSQKRKFQESPASSKNLIANQGSECVKPGLDVSVMRNVSSVSLPKKPVETTSNLMLPPKSMPPPPPKFSAPESPPQAEKPLQVSKRSSNKQVSDTLLKLVEYGEDDEDSDYSGVESIETNIVQSDAPKPFWAL